MVLEEVVRVDELERHEEENGDVYGKETGELGADDEVEVNARDDAQEHQDHELLLRARIFCKHVHHAAVLRSACQRIEVDVFKHAPDERKTHLKSIVENGDKASLKPYIEDSFEDGGV